MTQETPIKAITAFLVVAAHDGTVAVFSKNLPAVDIQHEATLRDVEAYGAQAAREAGRLLLSKVMAPQPEVTARDRVAEALARRNEE